MQKSRPFHLDLNVLRENNEQHYSIFTILCFEKVKVPVKELLTKTAHSMPIYILICHSNDVKLWQDLMQNSPWLMST